MELLELIKDLFKKEIEKKEIEHKPISIKDPRVQGVQHILGQMAQLEIAGIKKSPQEYHKEAASLKIEIDELVGREVSTNDPELEALFKASREAYSNAMKSKSENAVEHREDVRRQGRFVLDPLTKEENASKEEKASNAKKRGPKR